MRSVVSNDKVSVWPGNQVFAKSLPFISEKFVQVFSPHLADIHILYTASNNDFVTRRRQPTLELLLTLPRLAVHHEVVEQLDEPVGLDHLLLRERAQNLTEMSMNLGEDWKVHEASQYN